MIGKEKKEIAIDQKKDRASLIFLRLTAQSSNFDSSKTTL
jgi:hypothetical protein